MGMTDRLQYIVEHSFWPVWLLLTAVALVSTALLVRRPASSPASAFDAPLPAGHSRRTAATFAFSILFLTAYLAVILVGEEFTGYDNSQFTMYSVRGVNFPNPIWRESGRFFPLGLQQFNVLRHVTRSAVGYHAVGVLQIIVLFSIILMLDQQLSVAARAALAALTLVLPSVVHSFMGLIYPECDVAFWITCLALSVEFFARTRSVGWALAAVLSTQFALYYKEPVFLFLLTFALVRVFLRVKCSGSLREEFGEAETRLDLSIAAMSLAFVAFYSIAILGNSHLLYLEEHHVSRLQTVYAYLRFDWLIWVFAAFTLARMYRVVRGTAAPALLWDGLACGALAYVFAYLALGMVSEYYLAPADLIAVLYLGRFLFLSWDGMTTPRRALSGALTLLVVIHILDWSTIRVVERKYVIQRKASVANVIVAMRTRDPGRVKRLYFPFTPPLGVAEFAAYLTYRSVPVEQVGHASSDGARVELYSPLISRTGRCAPLQEFLCHAGPAPDGELTVVLPDDTYPSSGFKLHHELEQKLILRDPPSRARALYFRSLDKVWSFADKLRRPYY